MESFEFDIMDVVTLLHLNLRRPYGTKISCDAQCPFCDDRHKHLNINIKKQVFRCNRCGESGGKLDLYAKVYGLDRKEAYARIKEALSHGEKASEVKRRKKEIKVEKMNQITVAPDIVKNDVYTTLFSLLHLSDTHRSQLRERGLSDDVIDQNGYKSVPAFGYRKLVAQLREMNCAIEGVAGFYMEADEWTINFRADRSGILIPVRSLEGKFVGVQIRLDQAKKQKYLWLSSINYEKGTGSGSPIHFVGNPDDKIIYFTEGPLKGDVAHYLSGRSFACVPGANQYTNLVEFLIKIKNNGAELCMESYDMDKFSNEYVMKGVKKFHQAVHEIGLKSKQVTWDSKFKGVDDYLYASKS